MPPEMEYEELSRKVDKAPPQYGGLTRKLDMMEGMELKFAKESMSMKAEFEATSRKAIFIMDAMSMKVLRHIDAVSDLCNGIVFTPERDFSEIMWLIDGLTFFRNALQRLQRQVKKVSIGMVDEARLSPYEGLYSICLGELIAVEGTLARLSEKINAFTDWKAVSLHDGSISTGLKTMRPVHASLTLLDGPFGSILEEFKRQENLLNLCQKVHSLIEADSEIEFRSVLNAAFTGGHIKLVWFLTDSFNHGLERLVPTSSAASLAGHEDVVPASLAQEDDVDLLKVHFGNALQKASFKGHEKSVRTLLHQKVDVNAQGGRYGNALQAASCAGHTEIVTLLINKKAHVNNQGGYYGNALQAASFGGHQDIVQLLLDQQADVNAQGGYYGNAIQAASFAGHEDIVKLLFHKKANVIAQGGYFGNAFQAASFAGHKKIVKFLFHQKANVNAQGGYYGNALQAASFIGHKKIIRFLIEKGIDVNAQGGHFGHALQAASFAGHEDIVRILLNHGASVNATGGRYGNALQAASCAGHQKIVQVLLGREAYVHAKGLHGTALQAALSSGHEDAVELLNEFLDGNSCTLVQQIAVWMLRNGFFKSLLAKTFKENTQMETFWQGLAQLIERYGENLVELTRDGFLITAASCFISHRWHMIEAISSLCTALGVAQSESEAKVTKSRAAAPWNDGLNLIVPNPDVELSRDESRKIYEYFTSTTAPLNSFLGSVCRLVYSNPLEAVRAELLRGFEIRSRLRKALFLLNWRIEEYLDKEIVRTRSGEIDRRIVGSVLTLSGDARECYANSCEVYMKWKWPDTYHILLEALALGSNDEYLGVHISNEFRFRF